jgi:hypothetical protein
MSENKGKTRLDSELAIIGEQLDNHPSLPLAFYPGGVVKPHDFAEPSMNEVGEDSENEQRSRQQSRSKTRPRRGPTRRQRETEQSRAPCKTKQAACADFADEYLAQVGEVKAAYPQTRIWEQDGGLLLLSKSQILSSRKECAAFVVAIPYSKSSPVKGWGYWIDDLIKPSWIGPRHTNCPDGTICAFKPSDGTWSAGGSIRDLLDKYTLWALCHLYLKVYGRWPGFQYGDYYFERLLEFRSDEYCGCNNFSTSYGDCCQKNDIAFGRLTVELRYILSGLSSRKPPESVSKFILNRKNPPKLEDLL